MMLIIYKDYPAKADPCKSGNELFKDASKNKRKSIDFGSLIKPKFGSGYNMNSIHIRT